MSRATTPARSLLVLAVALLAVAGAALGPGATSEAAEAPATPAQPVADDPWIISLGDSYISGEGGRWAGNTVTLPTSANDALGPTAYFDNPTDTGELIPYCHRSKSAEVHIRDVGELKGFNTLNLACSGAETSTYWSGTFSTVFKPGIDFYDDGNGHLGQAAMLQAAAEGVDVGMVVLSIGGNDFDVSGIATACVEDFIESVITTYYCHTDPAQIAKVAPAAATRIQGEIQGAIANIRTAMANAGHALDAYELVVQTYPQPIPYGSEFRYPETGNSRVDTGGCGFWDADANWMVNEVMGTVNATVRAAVDAVNADPSTPEIHVMELAPALDQRQLCQDTVGLLEEEGLTSWTQPGAVDRTEWINPVDIDTVTGPHFQQESLHPNYWAQLGLRSCLRQVWNDGDVRSGTCVRSTGLDADGEPNMVLRGALGRPAPVAGDDRFEGTGPIEVASPGVLANDTSAGARIDGAADLADGSRTVAEGDDLRFVPAVDALTARLVAAPTAGEVVLLADGSFRYTPAPGFTGTDRFTYAAVDFYGVSELTTVELVVGAPDAPSTTPLTPRFTG